MQFWDENGIPLTVRVDQLRNLVGIWHLMLPRDPASIPFGLQDFAGGTGDAGNRTSVVSAPKRPVVQLSLVTF